MNLTNAFEVFGLDGLKFSIVCVLIFLVAVPFIVGKLRGNMQSPTDKVGTKPKSSRMRMIIGGTGIFIMLAMFVLSIMFPIRTYIYAGNFNGETATIIVDGAEYEIGRGQWKKIALRSSSETNSVEGKIGDEVLFSEDVSGGLYIANMSPEAFVFAEKIEYSITPVPAGEEDYDAATLTKPGIKLFSENKRLDVHPFEEDPPEEIEMKSGSSAEIHYDISWMQADPLMEQLLNGVEEGGLEFLEETEKSLDSLELMIDDVEDDLGEDLDGELQQMIDSIFEEIPTAELDGSE